jgi:hypothetical protein
MFIPEEGPEVGNPVSDTDDSDDITEGQFFLLKDIAVLRLP